MKAGHSKSARPKKKALNHRQKLFVKGVAKGKTQKQAALDAGYAEQTAKSASGKLMKNELVRNEFQRIFNKAVSDELLVKTIKSGLNAKETKFFQHEGKVTEKREVIDHATRHRYVETACRIKDVLKEKMDITMHSDPRLESLTDEELAQLAALQRKMATPKA